MKITLPLPVILLTLLGSFCSNRAAADPSALTLWYRQPAAKWTEALPLGNGRLGAMVFGGVPTEHLQLNEGTLWAGGPYNPNNPKALAALPEVRRLIFAGQYDAASALVSSNLMAVPLRQLPYETLGDLYLDFPTNGPVTDYRRELDLATAVAGVSYTVNGVHFKRECFASTPDQVILIRLTADQPGQISFTAGMKTLQNATLTTANGNTIVMTGMNGELRGIPGVLHFVSQTRVLAEGGTTRADDRQITVTRADAVTILVGAATSYINYHDVSGHPDTIVAAQLATAAGKPFATLRQAHVQEHQRLFNRVSLDVGTTPAASLPTDERIVQFAKDNDPQLAALYFQFGRYLLISCSRPGGQPATLQGLWNDSMTPPWDSKYTININTEMNYWPAEPANLPECVEPLTRMVLDLTDTGARTAQSSYHARGWVVHHNTDLWRATAPIDGPKSGMWPMGGAWLCQNLWEHYLFNPDTNYLQTIYPALKGATLFFLDTLVEEPTHHWLVTNPSLSPENNNPAAKKTSLTAGPTMDLEILRDLFDNFTQAGETLGVDAGLRRQVAATRARLAPLQIGSAGQLQEWLQDIDLQSKEPHHRHVSHLYGLYPSAQIDLRTTPALAAAVKKSLELRGDQATGWATAWRINLWARLHDGDHAYRILGYLLSPARTCPDMFDLCPPFQIDGNFGGAAGIAEMLLQSQNGEINLLPALPSAWPDGSVKGLRARGGFEVDLTWHAGKLVTATLRSQAGLPATLRYGNVTRQITTTPGQQITWTGRE